MSEEPVLMDIVGTCDMCKEAVSDMYHIGDVWICEFCYDELQECISYDNNDNMDISEV